MFEEPKMEKLTTNLPPVEIARMDMLIEAGYYSSRAEFIRDAIRERLDSHQDFISKKLEQMAQGAPEESKDKEIVLHAVVLGVLDLD
ncbi:MAG: ribbon-helix-helix protein, CopG family, partial [Candidatus Bathyarchaeota archaeon]